MSLARLGYVKCVFLLSVISESPFIISVISEESEKVRRASGNLCVWYFIQENEFAQASSYADLAVNSDRYNPSALTNKGNTVFANGDYEKAAEFYKEALRNDCSCTEALYNIGE